MLDFRIKTFLEVCRRGSYTKAAASLHLTQPAVTQHIQHLEKQFGTRLLLYTARELSLTPQGKMLYDFAAGVETNLGKLHERLENLESGSVSIRLGTTENIGEYIMPDIVSDYLACEKCDELRFMIGSTNYLLELLTEGRIKFAIVDGQFDKQAFSTELLFTEKTVIICAPDHPKANTRVGFQDLLDETLIVRAQGSTPRIIIDLYLQERNQSVDSFSNYIEINNLNVTKKFVQKGMGIAFIYHHAVKEDIANGLLGFIEVPDFHMLREINYVALKDDFYSGEYRTFLDYCRRHIAEAHYG